MPSVDGHQAEALGVSGKLNIQIEPGRHHLLYTVQTSSGMRHFDAIFTQAVSGGFRNLEARRG
jgi:hypothetical protein